MKLTKDQAQDLLDLLVDANIVEDEEDVRFNYSGRAMYGKTCLGIVVNGSNGFAAGVQFAAAIGRYNQENLFVDEDFTPIPIAAFASPRSDSMGYGMILYWTGITVE